MRLRFLDILVCPDCLAPFELGIDETAPVPGRVLPPCRGGCPLGDAGTLEVTGPAAATAIVGSRAGLAAVKPFDCGACNGVSIERGRLTCRSCKASFPVVRGIPRVYPGASEDFSGEASLGALAPHPNPLPRRGEGVGKRREDEQDVLAFREANRRTQDSFSFEWLRYEVRDKREDVPVFIEKTGLKPPALNGRRVLDAGCGLGRYLEVAARYAQEIVGIDLGLGLERADVAHLSHVHRVQGDLLKPPFRHDAFDVAFSIGVLHHTPSTETAFRSVAKRVAPGGVFSVWVYEHQQWFRTLISELVRAVTTRLPHRALEALCFLAVPKGILEHHLRRSPATRPLARLIGLFPPVQVDPRWRVVLCDTFDWYSPEYQFHHAPAEVRGWYLSEDFKDVTDLPFPVSLVGTKKHT